MKLTAEQIFNASKNTTTWQDMADYINKLLENEPKEFKITLIALKELTEKLDKILEQLDSKTVYIPIPQEMSPIERFIVPITPSEQENINKAWQNITNYIKKQSPQKKAQEESCANCGYGEKIEKPRYKCNDPDIYHDPSQGGWCTHWQPKQESR